MIIFCVICAILLVIALAFILPPLLRPAPRIIAKSVDNANVAVYRDQLAEMESDLDSGLVAKAQFQRDREELERRLLEDVAGRRVDMPKRSRLAQRKMVYALAVGLPLLAILLYLKLGNPAALWALSTCFGWRTVCAP